MVMKNPAPAGKKAAPEKGKAPKGKKPPIPKNTKKSKGAATGGY